MLRSVFESDFVNSAVIRECPQFFRQFSRALGILAHQKSFLRQRAFKILGDASLSCWQYAGHSDAVKYLYTSRL